ncbi:hypothetical protein L9F63_019300, partial [Diploptera punctata]
NLISSERLNNRLKVVEEDLNAEGLVTAEKWRDPQKMNHNIAAQIKFRFFYYQTYP